MSAIQVGRMKYGDLIALDRLWSASSEETKLFFHPGIFKAELKATGHKPGSILSRITLLMCTNALVERLLRTVVPFFAWITLVASDGHQILGLAFIKGGRLRKGTIGIFVLDEHQGRGFGRLLMRTLLATAADSGFRRVCLTVLESNFRARRLYQHSGFTYTGRIIKDIWKGEPHISLEMVLEIADSFESLMRAPKRAVSERRSVARACKDSQDAVRARSRLP